MIGNILQKKPYLSLAIWIAIFTIAGFWVNYYGRLPLGVGDKNIIVHLHALIFTGWMVILIMQARFAATGQMKKHMALGRIGIYWGWLLIIMGLIITLYVFQRILGEYDQATASRAMLYPFFDMVFFAPVFALAVKSRNRPAIHKRLMLVAVCVLLIAPTFRLLDALDMQSDITRPIIWMLPLVMAQASDFMRHKGWSKIYISAIILLPLSEPFRMAIGETAGWAAFTGWIAGNL